MVFIVRVLFLISRLALSLGVLFLLPTPVLAHNVQIPSEYAGLRNPIEVTQQALTEGKRLYQNHCQNCHGLTGKGDGPTGAISKPPDLAAAINHMPDGFFYWRVAKGARTMPGFDAILPEREIWLTISYVRTLPQGAAELKKPTRAPGVHIYQPEDGAAIEAGNVPVRIHLANFSGLEGQVRYSLDGGPEYSGGMTSFVFSDVKPGPHLVTVRLVDKQGRPFNPDAIHTVSFHVKSPLIPRVVWLGLGAVLAVGTGLVIKKAIHRRNEDINISPNID